MREVDRFAESVLEDVKSFRQPFEDIHVRIMRIGENDLNHLKKLFTTVR